MPHVHTPGLVLRLCAQTLMDDGARYTGAGLGDVDYSAFQYYVCIEANARDGLWVPLFAAPSAERIGVAASSKSGHPRWTRYTSFYDRRQLCLLTHKAAQRAAAAGYDESTPKAPNRMAAAALPARAEFPDGLQLVAMAGNLQIR